jgi:hypothetical protein
METSFAYGRYLDPSANIVGCSVIESSSSSANLTDDEGCDLARTATERALQGLA